MHAVLGLMMTRSFFHFGVSVLRVTPFANKFVVRIFFVLIEEFFYPGIDLLATIALGYLFCQVSDVVYKNGLEQLKQSSNNAQKFYDRNSYLLSRNLEDPLENK
jgi:hypothetical protein